MLEEFKKVARWIGRSEDPFINFSYVFDIGIESEELSSNKSIHSTVYVYFSVLNPELISIHTFRPGHGFYLYLYALTKSSITGFTHHMAPFKNHGDKLNPLTQQVCKPYLILVAIH